jgi:IS5 family transposase
MEHELVELAHGIDWKYLDEKNSHFYSEESRPGVSSRLMIGLPILKYMFNLSDESICERWVYDPYFQDELKMECTSMTHWLKRVGDEFCEILVPESLHIS